MHTECLHFPKAGLQNTNKNFQKKFKNPKSLRNTCIRGTNSSQSNTVQFNRQECDKTLTGGPHHQVLSVGILEKT